MTKQKYDYNKTNMKYKDMTQKSQTNLLKIVLPIILILITFQGVQAINMFVAVADGGNIRTSEDGENWDLQSTPFSTNLRGVTFSLERQEFVAVGSSGTYVISQDGINWESGIIGSSIQYNGVTWGGGHYVAVANNGIIAYSSNGTSWTELDSLTTNTLNEVAYSEELEKYIAIGNNGFVYTSTNLDNWTLEDTGIYTRQDVLWNELHERFVVVGNNGAIFLSEDGKNWSTIYVGSTVLFSVTQSLENDIIVGVGQVGVVRYSEDGGDNWTQTFAGNNNLRSSAYSPQLNKFVAVGDTGNVRHSEDGKNWTTSGTAGGVTFRSVTWGTNETDTFTLLQNLLEVESPINKDFQYYNITYNYEFAIEELYIIIEETTTNYVNNISLTELTESNTIQIFTDFPIGNYTLTSKVFYEGIHLNESDNTIFLQITSLPNISVPFEISRTTATVTVENEILNTGNLPVINSGFRYRYDFQGNYTEIENTSITTLPFAEPFVLVKSFIINADGETVSEELLIEQAVVSTGTLDLKGTVLDLEITILIVLLSLTLATIILPSWSLLLGSGLSILTLIYTLLLYTEGNITGKVTLLIIGGLILITLVLTMRSITEE